MKSILNLPKSEIYRFIFLDDSENRFGGGEGLPENLNQLLAIKLQGLNLNGKVDLSGIRDLLVDYFNSPKDNTDDIVLYWLIYQADETLIIGLLRGTFSQHQSVRTKVSRVGIIGAINGPQDSKDETVGRTFMQLATGLALLQK